MREEIAAITNCGPRMQAATKAVAHSPERVVISLPTRGSMAALATWNSSTHAVRMRSAGLRRNRPMLAGALGWPSPEQMPPSARTGSISLSRTRDSAITVGMARTAVTKKTACADTKWPQAPITPAASPLPIAEKRALRLSLAPRAAWPTRPRVMAAMAGPSTELAPTCRSLAPQIARNTGKTAISRAETPMPITASMAARRLERAASTIQPPGTWHNRPAMLPMESTRPMSTWVHF